MAPPGSEHYAKNAIAAPSAAGIAAENIEPWADALDELDPRELAMSRFRARNEVMAEIFGPERVRESPHFSFRQMGPADRQKISLRRTKTCGLALGRMDRASRLKL